MPAKFTLEVAEKRVMKALDMQTGELETYYSTPHTQENQSRIRATLNILHHIIDLKEKRDGNKGKAADG